MSETTPQPLPDDYDGYVDAPDPTELAPPVITVRPAEVFPVEARAARSWATVRATPADGSPVKLIDAHPARSALHLTNLGPAVAYVGLTPELSPTMGHALPVNGQITMRHREAVYVAIAAGGALTTVTGAAEYLDG